MLSLSLTKCSYSCQLPPTSQPVFPSPPHYLIDKTSACPTVCQLKGLAYLIFGMALSLGGVTDYTHPVSTPTKVVTSTIILLAAQLSLCQTADTYRSAFILKQLNLKVCNTKVKTPFCASLAIYWSISICLCKLRKHGVCAKL